MKRRARTPSTRTFRVEKLDITGHKLDDSVCDANPLLYQKHSIHHVNEAVFKSALPNEFDAFSPTDGLCLGGCIDVDLVKRNEVLLVISR